MDPARVGIAAYAHYRPLTERREDLARGKNRRVEVIILNNRYE
jgi:flagellar motor protein MotB